VTVSQPKTSKIIKEHAELRKALRDTDTYSSDLQGDADVRDYRQIPLEIDPPRHHLYRSALAPYFVKPAIEKHLSAFRANSIALISRYFDSEPSEVIPNLCLPLVMQNLGVIYNRPQDVEEWISWGPDVWTAESEVRSGNALHRYIDRTYEGAIAKESDDIWQEIAHLEIEGRQITEVEFRGIAGVLLAGGRDTVVKLLTGILWHFARKLDDLQELRRNPQGISAAIQEFLRFLTPLPLMNRTTVPESDKKALPLDRYVGMSFISANFDPSVFKNPFSIDLKRPRNPHLSFGFGPHTCLGNHIAEIEAKVFLESLIESRFTWQILSEKTTFHEAPTDQVPDQFKSLQLIAISNAREN